MTLVDQNQNQKHPRHHSNPAVIYHNQTYTSIIIDIPTSIAVAQELPSTLSSSSGRQNAAPAKQNHKHIISITPLAEPYPSPPEPKSEAARRKVLDRVSEAERLYHEDVVRAVKDGLDGLREEFHSHCQSRKQYGDDDGLWCRLRGRVVTRDDGDEDDELRESRRNEKKIVDEDADAERPRKRSKTTHRLYLHEVQEGGHIKVGEEKQDIMLRREGVYCVPMILSPGTNRFESLASIFCSEVRNPSHSITSLQIPDLNTDLEVSDREEPSKTFCIPPQSSFVLASIGGAHRGSPSSTGSPTSSPVPGLSTDRKFDLILLDPPWPNKSVRRSAHYATHGVADMDTLRETIRDIIKAHLKYDDKGPGFPSIAAIWFTNKEKARQVAYSALQDAGLAVVEEWIWLKVTTKGVPVTPLDGLWRKPYEILIVARRRQQCGEGPGLGKETGQNGPLTRRIIAAVPDIHSRKPNLRALFGTIFFSDGHRSVVEQVAHQGSPGASFSGLEVFARNLTAGWCSCGDEVLKFNQNTWWYGEDRNNAKQ